MWSLLAMSLLHQWSPLLLEDQWQHNGEGGKVIGIATPKCSIKDYRSETQNQQNTGGALKKLYPEHSRGGLNLSITGALMNLPQEASGRQPSPFC